MRRTVFNCDVTYYFERLDNNRILSSGPVIDESVHICNYHMSVCLSEREQNKFTKASFHKIVLRKVTGVFRFQNLTGFVPEHI
jgi:hypothetical protein